MSKEKGQSRIKKRKVKKRRKLLYILIPFLVLIGGATVYGAMVLNKAEEVVEKSYEDEGREGSKSELREKEVDPTADDVSILIIGVDQSEKRRMNNESNSLSDALILATLNKEKKSVKMVSVPRDTYVYVPELGYETKINHAHSAGGTKASIETVEQLLDIPVDYYVKLNFEAFIDVIDTLDGIEVDVPYELYEQNSKDEANAIHLLPGEQLLNGEEALALARTRKQDNDIERGKRQQEIIKAIVDRSISFNTLLKVDDLMEAVGNNMKTNMNFDEIKSFVSYGSAGGLDIETLTLKGYDLWTDAYYYQLDEQDLAEKKEILKEHLDITSTTTTDDSENDSSGTNYSQQSQVQ
ncbi:LCP family protein [Aquibacillus koreensis]|uniref:LCP family protein n=1 Tax=Aquibacillus koreensis TaxID=279446 RepID=A0A9X4AHK0_9BACI|nr:LCP family protein [Aquibacillus koreensis]MCT2535284.1 LCP family protein [Aquibacillus koreensis]MDC3419784.1 LCP family protein [Aquibacillus koreensis]